MKVVGGITAAVVMIGGVIGIDALYLKKTDLEAAKIAFIALADERYTRSADLQAVKNEIINELRQEVSKNRAVMLATMQRDADDLEFMIMEIEQDNKKVPRYILEKFKQITRQIEELQDVITD